MSTTILHDYECQFFDFKRTVTAASAGKARYDYLLDVQEAYPDASFKHIRVRSLGRHVPRESKAVRDAREFNERYPEGTLVRYWTGLREGEGRTGKTRSIAVVISDHASVWVEGLVGSVNLSHVEVMG